MDTLSIRDMMDMQTQLHELHPDWEARGPENAQHFLIFTLAELGELAQVFQKRGWTAAAEPGVVREHLIEETGDVFMFLFDMLASLGITPEEFSAAYVKKHAFNTRRTFDNEKFTTDG